MTAATEPSMAVIAEAAREALQAPYVHVIASENMCDHVCIRVSLQQPEAWTNGIFENSPSFIMTIDPEGRKRRYDGGKVTAELLANRKGIPSFRKYTSTPDKVIQKIADWMATFADSELHA